MDFLLDSHWISYLILTQFPTESSLDLIFHPHWISYRILTGFPTGFWLDFLLDPHICHTEPVVLFNPLLALDSSILSTLQMELEQNPLMSENKSALSMQDPWCTVPWVKSSLNLGIAWSILFSWRETRWHTLPRTHAPPWHFLYLTKTKSWKWEEGGEEEGEGGGEKVSLKTHARGMGKNLVGCRLNLARVLFLHFIGFTLETYSEY